MFKKLMKRLANNPGLKLLSLLIAVVLWLIAVDIDDYDGFADAVFRLYNSPEDIKRMVNNAYEYGRTHYSSTQSTAELMRILALLKRE